MLSRLKLQPLPRADGSSRRLVNVGLAARFVDELLSGLPDVLMPTIRAQLGLSYTQISLLYLVLTYVAAVVEPVGGVLIDLWQRRWLMVWGAVGVGVATAVIGIAPTFLFLAAGFAIYGLASGPLAHTADVVLVEAYPEAPDRIYTRSVIVDTAGALLAPLLVTAAFWFGLEWRRLLITAGFASVVYAVLIWRTVFPPPAHGQDESEAGVWLLLRANLKSVLSNRRAAAWLLFLFCYTILEAPFYFTTVWLSEEVGMSQAFIGVYKSAEMAASIAGLYILDRWLTRSHYRSILQIAGAILLLVIPLWLLAPGIWVRFALMIPLSFFFAVLWPIGKAQSLAAVPGKAGTVTAVYSLMGFVPLPLLFGLLAEVVGLTTAMLWVGTGATVLMLVVVHLMRL
jgi:MFS transporter, FSR family, fosmidomycin resistance protein